jgi:hypothetical protein
MKKLLMLLALLALFFNVSGAFAADGDELSTTSFRVNSDGQVIQKALYEVMTTNDTVTAGETGKTFFLNYNTGVGSATSGLIQMTLPTAAAGLTYTFTTIYGNTRNKSLIRAASTDTFDGNCVTAATTTTFAAGDDLISAGATGDTVTLIGASTKWYCTNRTGTWADANTSY